MKRHIIVIGLGAVLLLIMGGNAPADILFTSRVTNYAVTFTDQIGFSDASARYDALFDATGDPGDTDSLVLNLKSNHINFSWTGGGGLTVSNVADTAEEATADLESDGDPGTMEIGYDTTAIGAADFLQSWIVLRNSHTLEFFGGGGGIIEEDAPFELNLSLSGDWSSIGTRPGQLEFQFLNPAWTIDEFFVFDGTNTNFSAHIDEYDFQDPDLNFKLHSTPEPSYIGGLAVSLLGMGLYYRRQWSKLHFSRTVRR